MASTAPPTRPALSAHLAERIRAHQEEVARLRLEIGDPQEALFRFVTEHFDVQAFVPDDQRDSEPTWSLWDDDELDAR